MKRSLYFIPFFLLFQLAVNAQWNGNPEICNKVNTAKGDPIDLKIVSDGSGGAFVFWIQSTRNDSLVIKGEHLSANGTTLWTNDYSGKILVYASWAYQYYREGIQRFFAISDEKGGAFIGYYLPNNFVTFNTYDLRVQRFSNEGNPSWSIMGTKVTNDCIVNGPFPLSAQESPKQVWLLADGNGGLYTTWTNGDSYIARIQKIGPDGSRYWPDEKPIFPGAVNPQSDFGQMVMGLAKNAEGEVAVFVNDFRNGISTIWETYENMDVYAQLFSLDGQTLWGSNGLMVGGNNTNALQMGDGKQGHLACTVYGDFIMVWRNSYTLNVQRISRAGVLFWPVDGISVPNPNPNGYFVFDEAIFADGFGGAFITWIEPVEPFNLKAQRLKLDGSFYFNNGVPTLASGSNYFNKYLLAEDPSHRWLYATWSSMGNIVAQRFRMADGGPDWKINGVLICGRPDQQEGPVVQPLPDGGMIAAWYDYRDSVVGKTNGIDIYANKIFTSGTLPVKVGNLTAATTTEGNVLFWTAHEQASVKYFEVEASANGSDFAIVSEKITPKGMGYEAYTWLHKNATQATQYYRVKGTETDGGLFYTNIVKLSKKNQANWIYNLTSSSLEVYHTKLAAGPVTIRVLNVVGQQIATKSWMQSGGAFSETLMLPANTFGVHYLQIFANDQSHSYKVFVPKY